jgi:hypothetical protein
LPSAFAFNDPFEATGAFGNCVPSLLPMPARRRPRGPLA